MIYKVLKRIVTSIFTILTFNLMVSPISIVIPLNIYTLVFTYVFGLLSLPFFSILIMFFS